VNYSPPWMVKLIHDERVAKFAVPRHETVDNLGAAKVRRARRRIEAPRLIGAGECQA
jgi:hypothetical protein